MKIETHYKLLTMKASSFTIWASVLMTFAFNVMLLKYVILNTDISSASGIGVLLSIIVITFIITFTSFSFLALISPVILKTFLIVVTILNSAAIHFMGNYQVVLDRTMIGNILNTQKSESIELISKDLVFTMLILGLGVSCIVLIFKISRIDRRVIIRNMFIAFTSSVIFLYANASSWLWIDKHASVLGGKILPWSYIINTARHFSSINKTTNGQKPLANGHFLDNNKTVVVLVIGETARSANFSLYGYSKLTNPKLEKESNLLILKNTKSCTTYTTGSLKCILSPNEASVNEESLPTYLTRHGVDVQWRTNNWGEPPIKVSKYINANELSSDCEGKGCKLDEVLLTNLIDAIRSSEKQKVFVILHTKGSHGPSYYSRYTQDFNQFTPVCRDEEISKCSPEELINAYDNTLLYADHFLSTLIGELKSLSDASTAMIYISDHGESLGEYGLYLHGTPYAFAPDYQKDIPFLLWASDAFLAYKQINISDISQAPEHSQFNIFHTVMGAFGLSAPIYDRERDILQNAPSENE